MAKAKNLNSLFNQIQKAVNETLVEDVAPVATDILVDEIHKRVYGRYTPIAYNRTGALGAPSNVVAELESDGVLTIRNVATPSESVIGTPYNPPNDATFSGWVNDGLVPNIFNDNNYPWEEPANFIEGAIEVMESGVVADVFSQGMAKRGLPVAGKISISRK